MGLKPAWDRAYLCRVCMFSLRLRGFPPGTLVSPDIKTCTTAIIEIPFYSHLNSKPDRYNEGIKLHPTLEAKNEIKKINKYASSYAEIRVGNTVIICYTHPWCRHTQSVYISINTYTPKHVDTYACLHMRIITYTSTPIRACVYVLSCTYTHIHSCTCTYIALHNPTYMMTLMHTWIHTHTYTHTHALGWFPSHCPWPWHWLTSGCGPQVRCWGPPHCSLQMD